MSVRSSACSTTCIGRRRRCSIWSSTLPTFPATRRSCCSAWPAPSCSRSAQAGAAASGTPRPCCSSRSTQQRPSGCWRSSAAPTRVCASGSSTLPRGIRSSWRRCSRSCAPQGTVTSACRRRFRRSWRPGWTSSTPPSERCSSVARSRAASSTRALSRLSRTASRRRHG